MNFVDGFYLSITNTPPSSLVDSTMSPKVMRTEGKGIRVRSLACSTSGEERHVEALGWDYKEWQAIQLFTRTYTNQTSWLMQSWNTDEPWTNTNSQNSPQLGLRGSHHLPPYSVLYVWPWDQHPNVILSQDSQTGVLKFPKLGLLRLWGPITLCANLQLRWGLNQSYIPHWELSNGMLHATCT
jgi:hypothetical protein